MQNLSLSLEGELRTRDNTKTVDRWSLGLGLDYKLSKQHTLGAFYRYQTVRDDDDDLEPNIHMIGINYKFKF